MPPLGDRNKISYLSNFRNHPKLDLFGDQNAVCHLHRLGGGHDLVPLGSALELVNVALPQVTSATTVRSRSLDHTSRDVVAALAPAQTSTQQHRSTQQRLLDTEDDFSDREAEFDKFVAYKGN